VSLLINRGEEATTYVTPDVIGTEGERAAAALRARGFRVTITGSQPYPGVPTGIVIRQTPPGGFRIGGGEACRCCHLTFSEVVPVASCVSPRNGLRPQSISYATTPRE